MQAVNIDWLNEKGVQLDQKENNFSWTTVLDITTKWFLNF